MLVRYAFAGEGGAFIVFWFDRVLYHIVLLTLSGLILARALCRDNRLAWICLGSAALCWSLGDTYYASVLWGRDPMPYPSVADGLWMLFYPPAYAGVLLLARARLAHVRHTSWLDGVIGGLGIASVGAAVALGTIIDATGGDTLAVATNLAYPLSDMVLLSLVVGVLAVTGWRPGRQWLLIAAALSCFAVADTFYLFRIADQTYRFGTLLDSGWLVALTLLAFAAWSRPVHLRVRLEGWQLLAAPTLFGLAALGVNIYDHWARIPVLALALSSACIVALIFRLALVFRDNLRMIRLRSDEALTDALTGLANRRRLLQDLGDREAPRQVLALFDLDGFKNYNDVFGHPAGDALLTRLGAALAKAAGPQGTAYRMGGDEFCMLITAEKGSEQAVATAAAALSERGEGFDISASYGFVVIPHQSSEPAAALGAADRRMYRHKNRKRTSASRQTSDALLRVLIERSPILAEHADGVAALAAEVAQVLLVPDDEAHQIAQAAELHDVGKLAIPEAILNKRRPLNEDEWAFIKQHTMIGERILAAAPALADVARIVRSSHERWDGRGYPDSLAGYETPLGARIIAVCDAYEAMTSNRPYRAAMSREVAVATLAQNAGTQFDPTVVDAFFYVLETTTAPRAHPAPAAP